MANEKMGKSWGWVANVALGVGLLIGGIAGYATGDRDTAGYQLQIASLQSELAASDQNYEQVIDALNEQNIPHGLPADDQIANLFEFLTDNGTVKYDFTLSYHIDDDGMQSGDITINLKKGDKVDTD